MSNREALLEATKAARDARMAEKERDTAAVTVQSVTRGWLTRTRKRREWQEKVDKWTSGATNQVWSLTLVCRTCICMSTFLGKSFYFLTGETTTLR